MQDENHDLDVVLNETTQRYRLDLHKEPRQHHITTLINKAERQPNVPFLLIAHTIFPKLQEQLKEHHINYIDLEGNVYLQNQGLYIFTQNQKKKKQKRETGNRAFTKTGLKVIFHFLVKQEFINQNQRTIKDETGVALGNIPKVFEGLKETGYLIKKDKQEFILVNKRELIDR